MPKVSEKSPLVEKHYNDLKRIQASVKQTLEYCSKCDRCGLEVKNELAASQEQLATIASLLREFFPKQSQV